MHGLNVNDGIEDRDEIGMCVEPLAEAMALAKPFEQFIDRSAVEREGARSSAGDLDLTIYSLRKWVRLALPKYAMHMLRLGFQGVELLRTGRLSLPMAEPARSHLLDVRRGKVAEPECFTRAGELERELEDLGATSFLPEAPDEARVEKWVHDAYRRRWLR